MPNVLCLCFPLIREGTPKAVLEAMACGKAIITTDVPGCRETVEDGKNGYLIEGKKCFCFSCENETIY